MHRRTSRLGVVAIASILSAGPMMSHPAEAGAKRCVYAAQDAFGKGVGYGAAYGLTTKGACRRAKRRCNRSVKHRPFRGCHRVS
jgi:hypothetical protein